MIPCIAIVDMGIFAAQAYPSSILAQIEPPAFLAVPHSTNSHIWLSRFIGSDPKTSILPTSSTLLPHLFHPYSLHTT